MNTDPIFLYRKREIGDILSAGFQFVRQNFRELSKIFVRFLGPFFLLQVFMNSFYSYATNDFVSGAANTDSAAYNTGFALGSLFAGMTLFSIIGLVLTSVLFFTVLNATVFGVFKSYMANDGRIKVDEVSRMLKKSWPKFIGATLFIVLVGGLTTMLTAGTLSFLGTHSVSPFVVLLYVFLTSTAAAVFVLVPLSLVFPIMIFDEKNAFAAFRQAYRYLKGNWLLSFLTFVVVYLITFVISLIFQLPMIFYLLFEQVSGGVASFNASGGRNWIMIILTIVSQFFRYVISVLIPVFTAFIYFNLHEIKYKTGIYSEVKSIGAQNKTHY